jgi:arylsulfatase A-like enzyme
MLYEGGVRVPYIFRWTGTIAPGTACREPINSVDLYPTLLALTGAKAPENYTLDGVSYWHLLTGRGQGKLDRDAIYWHFPGYLGAGPGSWRTTPAGSVRSGDWKLIEFFETGKLELYNLRDDLGEKTDLAGSMPDRVKDLHTRLVAWRKSVNAPMPTPHKAEPPGRAGAAAKKKAARRAEPID